jgi:hypothetical protein
MLLLEQGNDAAMTRVFPGLFHQGYHFLPRSFEELHEISLLVEKHPGNAEDLIGLSAFVQKIEKFFFDQQPHRRTDAYQKEHKADFTVNRMKDAPI